ncbi:hypothetical protein [Streptomyces bauhiniae]
MPDQPDVNQKMQYSLVALMNYQRTDARNASDLETDGRLVLSALDRCMEVPGYAAECGRIRDHIARSFPPQDAANESQGWSEWAQDQVWRVGNYALTSRLDPASQLYGAVGVWEKNQSADIRERIFQQWEEVQAVINRRQCTFSEALHAVCPEFPPDLQRLTAEQKIQYSLTALMNYQGDNSRALGDLGGTLPDRLIISALARCAEESDYGLECTRAKNHIEGMISSQSGASELQNWTEWAQDKLNGLISESGSYALSLQLDAASQLYGAVGLWEKEQPSAIRQQIIQQWRDVQIHQSRSQCTFSEALSRVSPDFPPHLADSNNTAVANAALTNFPQAGSRPGTPPPAYSAERGSTQTQGTSRSR